jgi:ADP-heptose:LPS heptosyltransferase
VVGGKLSFPKKGNFTIIEAHNFDYEFFLNNSSERLIKKKYCVFLDQNYCFHFEYKYQNVPKVLEPELYFSTITHSLNQLSKKLNVIPVIALHPRTNYGSECFGGIRAIKDQSLALIKNSSFVIAHDSTSIQMAVLCKVPVIFITTNQLNQTYMDSSFKKEAIEKFASELGTVPINLDQINFDEINWDNYLNINYDLYNKYIENYIKASQLIKSSMWDIVISRVELDY